MHVLYVAVKPTMNESGHRSSILESELRPMLYTSNTYDNASVLVASIALISVST